MSRPLKIRTLLCLLCLAWQLSSRADIVVIVHPDNPVQSMTPHEVSDLYLGRSRTFSMTSTPAVAYEQPADSPLREAFFRALNGMRIKQVNAYWARLRFSGEVLPPATLPDSQQVLEAVSRNRAAIGYIDSTLLNRSVKVVLRMKES